MKRPILVLVGWLVLSTLADLTVSLQTTPHWLSLRTLPPLFAVLVVFLLGLACLRGRLLVAGLVAIVVGLGTFAALRLFLGDVDLTILTEQRNVQNWVVIGTMPAALGWAAWSFKRWQ